jgi:Na+-driven multidrug efflux pump
VGDGIRFAYRFSLFYGLAIGAFMLLFGGFIVDLFDVAGQARDTALLHMHVVPVSYIALGCAMTVNGALNALGKPVAAMWISLSRTIAVYAPLAWLLSQFLGLVGIFIAAASANAIAGGIGVYWLRLVYREVVADKLPRSRPA